MRRGFFWALVIGAALPGASLAANANHPYSNVDPSNDAGNDTGDSRVDQLNAAQLDGAQPGQAMRPRRYAPPPAPGYAPYGYAPYGYAPPPGYAPQPGYAPPGYAPPGYAPPGYAPPGYAPPGYAPPPGY